MFKIEKKHCACLAWLTSWGFILARSLRSAPAQKIPGVVDLRTMTRAFRSNRTASTASHSWETKRLLKEFLAWKKGQDILTDRDASRSFITRKVTSNKNKEKTLSYCTGFLIVWRSLLISFLALLCFFVSLLTKCFINGKFAHTERHTFVI